jgi:hypothetical protein
LPWPLAQAPRCIGQRLSPSVSVLAHKRQRLAYKRQRLAHKRPQLDAKSSCCQIPAIKALLAVAPC